MNPLNGASSPYGSNKSDSEIRNDEYMERKGKPRGRKHKLTSDGHLALQSKDSISAREQKKID